MTFSIILLNDGNIILNRGIYKHPTNPSFAIQMTSVTKQRLVVSSENIEQILHVEGESKNDIKEKYPEYFV